MNVMVQAVLRHLLTAGGTVLVTKGVLDAGSAEAVVGALVTLAGVVWSLVEKRGR